MVAKDHKRLALPCPDCRPASFEQCRRAVGTLQYPRERAYCSHRCSNVTYLRRSGCGQDSEENMFVASERHGMAAVTAPQDGRRRVWNLTSLSARRSYTAFQALHHSLPLPAYATSQTISDATSPSLASIRVYAYCADPTGFSELLRR